MVTLEGEQGQGAHLRAEPDGLPEPGRQPAPVHGRAPIYNDELTRTDHGWRIAQRIEEQAFLDGSLPAALKIPS